jgi:hypothetical protein
MKPDNIAREIGILTIAVVLGLHSAVCEAVLARPNLDAASYDSLVNEMVARIPAHTPEWTNQNSSDPGFALLDLFRFLDDKDLDILVTDFHDRSWWLDLEIDSEEYLGELAYSLLEAGLVIALPPNESVPTDWPTVYSVKLDQSFAELVASARIPEPVTLALFALGLVGLVLAGRAAFLPIRLSRVPNRAYSGTHIGAGTRASHRRRP